MRFTTVLAITATLAAAFLTTTVRAAGPKDAPGPIDSLSDLQDTAKMAFKLADSNNDGLISQKEAVDLGNLMVGGFFFRADADGDGKVTKAEADQAREALLSQRPLLRFVFERTQQETAHQGDKEKIDQIRADLMKQIDANQDGAIDATELRQAVETTVQSLFLTADRSGDGQLDPSELNGAVVEVGKAGIQTAFQAADGDKNGAVSRDEFGKAIIKPANVMFRVLDANNDGQITREELRSGVQVLVRELQNLEVAEPADSLPKQIINAVGAAPAGTVPAAAQPAAVAPVPAARPQ